MANAVALVLRCGDYLPRAVREAAAIVLAILAVTHPEVVTDGFETVWRAEAAAAAQLLQQASGSWIEGLGLLWR
ncbi:hypothetical protein [Demequina globuliformis]|uniref:hypothetical protein n=1 Tax=Demequina globuliformis TaxID=676202 RepID=UPI00078209D5|nr:hypothetical protein [Demequina globuliformis]